MSQSSSNDRHEGRAVEAVISLGSNTGSREWNILRAVESLAFSGKTEVKRLSSLYETEPVGEGFSAPFVNAACIVETLLGPEELLRLCFSIEDEGGRSRRPGEPDRPIDLDIILYSDIAIDTPQLKIPHPRFTDRLFVLVPLDEISPGLELPQGGGRISDLLERGGRRGWVRKISSRSLDI